MSSLSNDREVEKGETFTTEEISTMSETHNGKRQPDLQPSPGQNPQCAQWECASKGHGSLVSWARQQPHNLSAYHVLFTLIFLFNAIILVALTTLSILGSFSALTATSANILVAVLIRKERIINAIYTMCARTPISWPLRIRRHVADFHHYGGVHSGCGTAALGWFATFLILSTESILLRPRYPEQGIGVVEIIDITTNAISLAFLTAICVTALPQLRRRYHNTFEKVHRFGGWALLVALWTHTLLSIHLPPPSSSSSLHHDHISTKPDSLFRSPPLYLLSAATILILTPWLRIRKIPIRIQEVTPREIILEYGFEKEVPANTTVRISTSPWSQWHSFATIPKISTSNQSTNNNGGNNNNGSGARETKTVQMLISTTGDWTRTLHTSPPTTIYMRDPPTLNFLSLALLFKSIIVVATGAGIGPVLSYLPSVSSLSTLNCSDLPTVEYNGPNQRVRVLWCTRNPHNECYKFIMDAIRRVDSDPRVIDSSVQRVDLIDQVHDMVVRSRTGEGEDPVEAVFVVSRKDVTDRVVRGVRKRSMVASYGAVFDS